MDTSTTLAAFNEQIRRHAAEEPSGGRIERDDHVVRSISDGWNGLVWSDLDESNADAVIAAEVQRFTALGRPWEWKYYSYDRPADLRDRLQAAGLVPEPDETLLIAEISGLDLDVSAPEGVELVPVTDERGAADLVAVHEAVFGADQSGLGRRVLAGLAATPQQTAGVVAMAGGMPISAGRVEFHHGTDFASIWGGGTLEDWRGRGVFRALVAHRARLAAARGFRYLQVDASPDSRPILRRLGFVEMATTIPFVPAGPAA